MRPNRVAYPTPSGMDHSVARGNDCDVFWSNLRDLHARHAAMLDATEGKRRERYQRAADRDRFTLGAALLRLVLSWRFGVAPESLRIDRTCARCGAPHGKPRVLGYDVHLSVAHSGDYAAVAVTEAGPVGVDVEFMRPLDYERLAPRICTPEERASVLSKEDFYAYWTRKESVLKATGDGLRVSMQSVTVTPPTEAPRLLRAPDGITAATMIDLAPEQAYAGAATVLAEGPVDFHVHDARARVAQA